MDTLHGVLCNFYILWIKSPSRIGMLLKIHNAISRQRLIDWCCSILAVSWRLRQRKYTKKQKNQKDLHRFASSKRPHTITKMNDSKNMDNTIAGSVNASS